jgi:bacillithiol biosynthesis deacetylase BshB1
MPAPLDYLVIAAHPDDAELCLAGTILSLKAEGARVGVLDLTSGEPTPFGTPEIRARETAAATALMNLDYRGNLGLVNRSLVADLDARKKLASVIRELRPTTLITHYWDDAHPDHVAASALVDAARFWAKLSKTDMPGEPFHPKKIVYFYSMHLREHADPSFIVDVTPYLEKKLEIVSCFHSQFIQGKPTTPPTFLDQVQTLAAYWGYLIGVGYGEPFRMREEVGLKSLRHIL